jgi:hypothetical protein
MKKINSIKILLLISALSIVLGSCGDENKKRGNEFLIDELPVEAGKVYLSQGIDFGGNEGYSLVVTSTGISTFKTDNDADDFKGDGYVLSLYLENDITTPLKAGTYTFDSEVSPSIIWGMLNVLVEDDYSDFALVKSGTVKVSKSGSSYTLAYSVVVSWDETEVESTVTGYYSGKLKPAYILF